MEPAQAKPLKRRRRWLIVALLLVLVFMVWAWQIRGENERRRAFLVAANQATVLAMPQTIYFGPDWLHNDTLRSWLSLPSVWVNVHERDDAERLLGLNVPTPSRCSIQYDVGVPSEYVERLEAKFPEAEVEPSRWRSL